MPEFALIRRLAERVPTSGDDIECGIGDDAAVLGLASGERLVAATDSLNEGVHFLAGADPAALGHKALAVNLSDLAAMGARPNWALLNLSLPADDGEWVDRFGDGFAALARRFGVRLVGGDTCAGPRSVTVTVLGATAPGAYLRRDGARAGDGIWVSGRLGDAALALRRRLDGGASDAALEAALDRPEPRLALGARLVGLAGACIDLSDGLLADLGHITAASGVGARLELELLPASPSLTVLDEDVRWKLQLAGGEDYELCFTVPADREDELPALSETLDLPLTRIGCVEAEGGIRCDDGAGRTFDPGLRGWEHFSGAEGPTPRPADGKPRGGRGGEGHG